MEANRDDSTEATVGVVHDGQAADKKLDEQHSGMNVATEKVCHLNFKDAYSPLSF